MERMDELFGELRALMGQDLDARDFMEEHENGAAVKRRREARQRKIVATLESAFEEDPRRYGEEWMPYLERARLPVFSVRKLQDAKALRAFMPAGTFELEWRTSVSGTSGKRIAQDSNLELIDHITLSQSHERAFARSIRALIESPHLGNLKGIALRATEHTYNKVRTTTADAVLKGLASSKVARGVEHLEFHTFPSTQDAWDTFAASHAAQSLRSLAFKGSFSRSPSGREPHGMAASALSARGIVLRALRLHECRALEVDVLTSAACARLEVLELPFTDGDEALLAMASAPSPHPLRRFVSTGRGDVVSALMRSEWLSEVEAVDLMLSGWATMMDADAVLRYLAVAPPSQVTSLCLTALGVPDAPTLEALAAWPGLSRTHTLSMWGAPVDAAGLSALLGSPHLGHLTALDLTDSTLSPAALDVLASSPALDRLTSLNLNGCLQDEAAARVIIESPHLGGLKRLEVRGDGFTKNVSSSLRKRHPAKRLKVVSGEW